MELRGAADLPQVSALFIARGPDHHRLVIAAAIGPEGGYLIARPSGGVFAAEIGPEPFRPLEAAMNAQLPPVHEDPFGAWRPPPIPRRSAQGVELDWDEEGLKLVVPPARRRWLRPASRWVWGAADYRPSEPGRFTLSAERTFSRLWVQPRGVELRGVHGEAWGLRLTASARRKLPDLGVDRSRPVAFAHGPTLEGPVDLEDVPGAPGALSVTSEG